MESVLRVMNQQPVSEDARTRIVEAMDFLGFPRRAVTEAEVNLAVEHAQRQLTESLGRAASELELALPEEVGSLVYEAVRVEVRPVGDQMRQLGTILRSALQTLEAEVGSEKRRRLEDLGLLVDLITSSWQNVDHRLARLEHVLDRLANEQSPRPASRTLHVDDGRGSIPGRVDPPE